MRGVEIAPVGEAGGAIAVRSAAVGDGYFPAARPRQRSAAGGSFPAIWSGATRAGLHLVGRVSDVINIAGRKLNPLEVEARLAEFPGVKQVVVFGVPSALRGEEPWRAWRAKASSRAAMMRFCQATAQRMADAAGCLDRRRRFPTNERGKISRRALAESFLAYKGRTPKSGQP